MRRSVAWTCTVLLLWMSDRAFAVPIDGVFLLDESGSVNLSEFQQETTFVNDLANSLTFGPSDFNGGIALFADLSREALGLTGDAGVFQNAVNSLAPMGGSSNLSAGIAEAASMFAASARPGAADVLFLFADGYSGDDPNIEASVLKDSGTVIIPILLPGADPADFVGLASSPDLLFTIADFSQVSGAVDQIISSLEPVPSSQVSEPPTLALLGMGLIGMAAFRRRKRYGLRPRANLTGTRRPLNVAESSASSAR